MSLLVKNIKGLVQVEDKPAEKVCGKAMSDLPVINNAWIYIKGEVIDSFGSMENMPEMKPSDIIDAKGKYVLPSYCDSHTDRKSVV